MTMVNIKFHPTRRY